MRFDLFYELALPAGLTEREVIGQALEQIAAADHASLDGVWFAEHHFQRGFSHSSAPELLMAAVTQRTNRMRIGHGVLLLPFHNPVMAAERIATLDLLSDGRIDVGVGRGLSPLEFEVVVREGNGESRHHVTMSKRACERLTAGQHTPERCLEAAFRFLLDREPKESILRSFDVTVISRYFPEFERELPRYLQRSGS